MSVSLVVSLPQAIEHLPSAKGPVSEEGSKFKARVLFKLALVFPFWRAPFVTPSRVCSLRLAGVHAWPGPQQASPFLHSASPGKSQLNLVTLASGAVALPVHQPLGCHCSPTGHGHLPRSRPCSILAEAPCRPSRDGRVGAAGETGAATSQTPQISTVFARSMAVLQTGISQMAVGLRWISRALIVLLVWVSSYLGGLG